MATHEEIEKVRQAIMRYRELLDLMQLQLQEGERAYTRLFDGHDTTGMKEKDAQWLIAANIVDDPLELKKATLHMQFEARNMECAFEELYNKLVPE
jgi:hypothetical protein